MKKQSNTQESDLPKLSAPAQRALASVGIQRLDQLTKFKESEIKKLHGLGPSTIKSLHAALKAKGLTFANGQGK